MADTFTVIRDYLQAVGAPVPLPIRVIAKVAISINRAGSPYRHARFGTWGTLLYFLRIVDTDAVQQSHWNINMWTDEETLAWKNSYLANCNSITVAGSIFASVGLTAWSLPNLEATHWTARAFFACSMLLGILSVTFATSQQQRVALINNPTAMRLWLSRGRTDNDRYPEPFVRLPLESSISTSKIIAIPRQLLNMAVFLFIVGFGLYVLFSWLNHVATPTTDYRNVFISFMVALGTFGLYYVIWNVMRLSDDLEVTHQFELRKIEEFPGGSPLHRLEDELNDLHKQVNERKEKPRSHALATVRVEEEKLHNDVED